MTQIKKTISKFQQQLFYRFGEFLERSPVLTIPTVFIGVPFIILSLVSLFTAFVGSIIFLFCQFYF